MARFTFSLRQLFVAVAWFAVAAWIAANLTGGRHDLWLGVVVRPLFVVMFVGGAIGSLFQESLVGAAIAFWIGMAVIALAVVALLVKFAVVGM